MVIKLMTATKDRLLNRARPQIPWPLVHPLPKRVPKPTKKPPMRKAAQLRLASPFSLSWYSCTRKRREVKKKAAIRTSFQCWCGTFRADLGHRPIELIIPEAPRISPEKSSKMAADKPIKAPPSNPDTNECMVVFV